MDFRQAGVLEGFAVQLLFGRAGKAGLVVAEEEDDDGLIKLLELLDEVGEGLVGTLHERNVFVQVVVFNAVDRRVIAIFLGN